MTEEHSELRDLLSGCDWVDQDLMHSMSLDILVAFSERLQVYFTDDGKTLMLADGVTDAVLKRFSLHALQAEHAAIMEGLDTDFTARAGYTEPCKLVAR